MSKRRSPSSAPSERELFFRELFAERERRGCTYRALAAERGVPAGTLSWWRGEIRRRDSRREVVGGGRSMTRRPGAGDLTFVPIGLPPAEAEVDPVAFEILFPCGSIVRVPPHFDADGLARFVRVLSTTC